MLPTRPASRSLTCRSALLLFLVAGLGVALAAEDEAERVRADVVSVEVSGEPGGYRFAVGVASPDTGCEQYADGWEVVSAEGELIHRRVLAHSHIHEQPFVRSGGPLEIAPDEMVWVRAHMHPTGYGGKAWRGSVEKGFEPADPPADFAACLAEEPPLTTDCPG
ncbi:MAG: hypothetical protein AAF481_07120 [Acidobacteriota bacterium]